MCINTHMTKIRIDITIDPEVLDKLDEIRGDVKRSTYINNMIRRVK